MSQAVDRALESLWIINAHRRVTVTQLAEQLDVHKSTASRILSSLEKNRLVDRDAHTAEYSLGQGILQLAAAVTSQRGFTQSAQALSDLIAAETGLTANVAVLDDGSAVNVVQSESSVGFLQPRHYVGRRTPGHATSSGKVLLAYSADEAKKFVLGSDLPAFTTHTITDPSVLMQEFERIRGRGWGSADLEWEESMTAVAVPVFGLRGQVVAAATITAHHSDLPAESFADKASIMQEVVARFGPLLD